MIHFRTKLTYSSLDDVCIVFQSELEFYLCNLHNPLMQTFFYSNYQGDTPILIEQYKQLSNIIKVVLHFNL